MSQPSETRPEKNRAYHYLIGAMIAFLVVCACMVIFGVSSAGLYSGMPRDLFMPEAQPLDVSPAPPPDWQIAFSDDFASNANAWNISEQPQKDYRGTHRETMDAGTFRIEATASENDLELNYAPIVRDLSNFYASVDAQHQSGDATAAYGIIFRWVAKKDGTSLIYNGYVFEISDEQHVGIFSYQFGSQHEIKRAKSRAIRPGAVNHLAVLAQGTHLTFFINDRAIAAIDDDRLSSGMIGLGISISPGQPQIFQFSNLRVLAPP